MSNIQGLSIEEILKLQGASRGRNQYGPKVVEFENSSEAAVNVKDAWPEFKDKETTTLYQGFKNAVTKAKLDESITVKQVAGDVFMLHNDRVRLIMSNRNGNHADSDSDGE